MDLDFTLRIEKFTSPMDSSTSEERKDFEKWDHSNCMSISLAYSKVNLASIPRNTWWLGSSATTNISVSMRGCIIYRKQIDSERRIYIGNGKSVKVEAIGHFRLLLCIDFYLDLKDTFVVPSFRQNLVYVSYLDKLGCLCSFGSNEFILSLNLNVVRIDSLLASDNLHMLYMVTSYSESLNTKSCSVSVKLTILIQEHYTKSV